MLKFPNVFCFYSIDKIFGEILIQKFQAHYLDQILADLNSGSTKKNHDLKNRSGLEFEPNQS